MTRLGRWLTRYAPEDAVSESEVEQGLVWILRNGLAAQVMETLTVGAFLTAYALELGATNLLIGVLAAVPHLAQLAQLPGVYLVERYRARRAIALAAGAASRPMLLLMAGAAFFAPPWVALSVLVAAFALRYAFGGVLACGWNPWVRDLVPERRMGEFFGDRLMRMTAVGMVLGLAAAWFVDFWGEAVFAPAKYAFSVLLVGAFAGGVASVYCMARVPEPRMAEDGEGLRLRRRLTTAFRDANFRRLMVFLGSWNFAVNMAAPFFTVHMLLALDLDLLWVIAFTTLSQLANILVLREWGAIADRLSNKSVLAVCGPLFIACIFAWTFTTFPERHALTIPLLVAIHVFAGVATAGVSLASGNIALKLAPRGNAASYLATNSLVNSVAAGLAPVLGGLVADFFMASELSFSLTWRSPGEEFAVTALDVRKWDFFFLLATAIGLFSLHRLGFVREVGEVRERVVLAELLLGARRSVRNLSTVAGLRSLTEFPLDLLRRSGRRARRASRDAAAAANPGPEEGGE